jgi:phage tail sheath gpL-like
MPIQSTLPENETLPGSYWGMRLGARRGLIPVERAVAIVAAKLAAGTATALQKYEPSDESESDTLFGKGSECALMFRKAMGQSKKTGRGTPRIFVVPIADPGGTAATFTVTITGTATESKTLVIHLAGREVRVGVDSGDTEGDIAQAIVDKVTELGETMPVTAARALGVVTFTARQTGVNGNQIRARHDSSTVPSGTTVVTATAVAGVGAYTLDAALDVLVDRIYTAHAFMNITSTDLTAAETHLDERALPGTKAFGHGYFGSRASVSTTNSLATGADEEKIVVVGCEQCPAMPGEIATAMMILVES